MGNAPSPPFGVILAPARKQVNAKEPESTLRELQEYEEE
jgi:hypothetical protein